MRFQQATRVMLTAALLLLAVTARTRVGGEITTDSLYIRSDIRYRFSETHVTSRISNTADIAQDATFDVRLPDDAFISGYSMLIDGGVYPGTVKEKSAANQQFRDAVRRGESAGKVAAKSTRDTNEFVITVNVAAQSHVMFNLTYQELLQRRMGLYEHVIHINPGQVVPDLRVQVFINETREITELTVPEVRDDKLSSQVITGSNRFAQIRSLSPRTAEVTFTPTPEQQQVYSDRGVAGQFIVNYDVDHPQDTEGEILVSDGYFVHFFAPESLPPMGKRIMFVLDTSGSMGGRKIVQLREALLFILDELRPVDEFGIVLFSSEITEWNPEGVIPATSENVARAKQFARNITAGGGTNIDAALHSGKRQLSSHITKPSMLLFLTDGEATVGTTRPEDILENVKSMRLGRQAIYCLAFGNGADFGLLSKLSAQNQGFARKIFEDADSSLQLAGFYNEISNPLLSEGLITYLSDLVNQTSLTRTWFTTFSRGSEFVVAGRYNSNGQVPAALRVFVEGSEASDYLFQRRDYCIDPWLYHSHPNHEEWYHPRPWPCPPSPPRPPPRPTPTSARPTTFIERLWVHLTIRQLVEKTLETENQTATAVVKAKAEALRLSLKYQFVTPYTSMVATKPKNLETRSSFGSPAERGPAPTVRNSGVGFGLGIPPVADFLSPASGRRSRPAPRARPSVPLSSITQPQQVRPIPFNAVRSQPPQPALPASRAGPVGQPNAPLSSITQPQQGLSQPSVLAPQPSLPQPSLPQPYLPKTSLPQPSLPLSARPVPLGTGLPSVPSSSPDPPQKGIPAGINVEVNSSSQDGTGFSLCLDITTSLNRSNILLLSDASANFVVTGTLQTQQYGGHRKFESVSVRLEETDVLTVAVTSVRIKNKKYRWWQLGSLNTDDVTITDGDSLELLTPSNVSLVFHKYGIETRRSLSSPFITVAVKNTQNLSADSTGIIGSVLDLTNLQLGADNRLSFSKGGTQENIVTSTDQFSDGSPCHRIRGSPDLENILDI